MRDETRWPSLKDTVISEADANRAYHLSMRSMVGAITLAFDNHHVPCRRNPNTHLLFIHRARFYVSFLALPCLALLCLC
jgi:hypothetical protein